MDVCVRCGSIKSLEKDHIIPKSRGGTDEASNKRFLCTACHDYRHSRDNVIVEINTCLAQVGTKYFDPIRFTRWIMRLGVLEAFNTPNKISFEEGIFACVSCGVRWTYDAGIDPDKFVRGDP